MAAIALVASFITRTTALVAEVMAYVAYVPGGGDALLLETGDTLLTEAGDRLILE